MHPNTESWTIRLLLQPSVSGVVVSLTVSGLTVDIFNRFYGVFVVHCVKLMLRILELEVLLFDCFVYRQNDVTSCNNRQSVLRVLTVQLPRVVIRHSISGCCLKNTRSSESSS